MRGSAIPCENGCKGLSPKYHVLEAATGETALPTPQAASSCLVVMDIGLPGRSGPGAAHTIKEPVGSTRVVRLTIPNDDGYRNHAGAAAAGAWVAQGEVKTEL